MKFGPALLLALCGLLVPGFSLDRSAFSFTHYNLDLRVEPEQHRLSARGTITLRNDADQPQKSAVLQISSSLDWRSIRINDNPVQFVSQVYTSDIDHTGALSEAIVTLPREVPPHRTVDVQVGYEGVIPLDLTRLTRIGVPEERAQHSDWDQISPRCTAIRGIGYVTWYPVATEAAYLSDSNSVFEAVGEWQAKEVGSEMMLSFSTSTPAVTLISGALDEPASAHFAVKDSRKVSSFHLTNRSASVPSFLLGDYRLVEYSPAAKVYHLPGHENAAQLYGDEIRRLETFISWLGPQHRPVILAEVADDLATPFEADQVLLTPLNNDPRSFDVHLVHALVHSYFQSPRAWIDEGLAHFAQALWREQQAGRQGALEYMAFYRKALVDAEKAASGGDSSTRQSLILARQPDYYRAKAMFVWWMLRDMVGEVALKKAIAAYRPEYDDRPSYMQKLIEGESHRDLEWFFDDWVYRDHGLPDFRIVSAYTRPLLPGGYLITVSLENLRAAAAEVPVRVRVPGGDVTSRVEVHGKSTAVVRIELPSPPREVVVNDGSVPEENMEDNTFVVDPAK
ncbi:MAG: hypothetical protein JO249_05555 [Acidobacteria bacterium]|nr:hypothetical protein [Acidobacteriota bacterium]